MATEHIIALLVQERNRLDAAIAVLGGAKRRGRPRKDPYANAPDWVKPKRKKRKFTAKQRKEQAARMRMYWAKKKKGK
jgi:hypothetical protein